MDESWRNRISIRPDQMSGVPCIRELRIPVETVLGMLASGMSADEILEAFRCLERDDILAAMQYAASAVRRPPDDGGAGMLVT